MASCCYRTDASLGVEAVTPNSEYSVPRVIAGLHTVTGFATAQGHDGLTRDGALWVWGSKEISVTRWPLTLHTPIPTRWDVDLNAK